MADQVKPVVSDSNGDISMSIEETNRVRASLGLRPLDVGEKPEAPKEGTSKNPVSYMDMKKAEEEEAKAKELREKIADMKRSRQAQAKVMASKGLGDASDEEDEVDDAAKWVMRSRRKQLTAAEKMAKQLDEQDEEMQQYDEGALAGMKVTHDTDDFNTGETVILTLADQRVLSGKRGETAGIDVNDGEDELENVSIAEFQKTAVAKARAVRKKMYDATDSGQFDVDGKPIADSSERMLKKYDDFEVEGKRLGGDDAASKGVRLGAGGLHDATKEEQQAAIREKLKAAAAGKKLESLGSTFKIVSDYQTQEELESFKKSSGKVRKLRKKKKEALDLKPLDDESGDRGTREDRGMSRKREQDEADKLRAKQDGYSRAMRRAEADSAALRAAEGVEPAVKPEPMDEDPAGEAPMEIGEDDDDNLELTLALERARKSKLEKRKFELDAQALISQRVKEEEEEGAAGKGDSLVFSTTAEFCRNLPNARPAKRSVADTAKRAREEAAEDESVVDARHARAKPAGGSKQSGEGEDKMEEDSGGEDDGAGHAALEAAEAEKRAKEDKTPAFEMAPGGGGLDSEALAGRSISDALRLMREKGLKKESLAGRTKDHRGEDALPQWAEKDAEKMKIRPEDKREIVIQRLDEFGREMTTKEAWRKLNHNFHGKKPGAKKVEKRRKQFEEENRLKKINAGEQSVEQMQKVHSLAEKAGATHVVVGGANISKIYTMMPGQHKRD